MIDNGEARPKGKVEIKIGNMSFSAEGDQEWLDQQVTKLLKAAEEHGTMNAPSGARLGGLSTQHFATKEDWDDPANPPQEDEVK